MNIPLIRPFGLPLLLMAVVAPLLAGCNDSSPTEPKLAATPIPTPGNIAGAWTGKFDSVDFIDCDSNTPAQASFQQNGSAIVGTLNATENGCGFTAVTFEGTLQGNVLEGTLRGGNFQSGRAYGTLSGTNLEIELGSSCPGIMCIPGGQMHLHR